MAEQSPIDIPVSARVRQDGLGLRYRASATTVRDDGYALRCDPLEGGYVELDGHAYDLVQFHLHSPSEHTFAGRASAMELHLVHVDDEGSITVVGVMLEEGEEHPALEALLTGDRPTLDPTDLLPDDHAYVAYQGSRTTPPYSEGVSWRVLVHPIRLSAGQLDRFRTVHHGNARPVQPLGDRALGPVMR